MSDVVDWTHLAQPIQDQGNCGSCRAFGLTGVMEALYFQKYGKQVKLSERDLFFCAGGTCDTGLEMEEPLDYVKEHGVATEECCPYGDTINGIDHKCGDGKCIEWWVDGVKIASWHKLNTQEEVDAAFREGPVDMAMAVPQSFINYTGGVYHSLGWFDMIVGYHCIGGFARNFTEKWDEIRNSWAAQGWGEKSLSDHIPGEEGWARVKNDDAKLELEYYKVVINGPIPEPEPEPTPSDCTRGNTIAKVMNFIPWLLRRKGRFYYLNPR